MRHALKLLFILLFFQSCSSGPSHLQMAEELSRQGKYDAAIEEYRDHMKERLRVKERPEWENPYFYLILIGDLELGQGHYEDALNSYLLADENHVDKYLISDRIRSLALWLEKQDRLQEALELLDDHRERDPLLFDTMLDRISKELTRQEDIGKDAALGIEPVPKSVE